MKRILINATHPEEVRVAMVDGNKLYDFDLENRTREQKKANIYKGHITRVEPSLEAAFVEYGSDKQGFLSLREIAPAYFSADPAQTSNIRELLCEGTEVLVQIEKEERGNKGAALSTFISLAGRYLVLMPNNPKGGSISRQISGNVRDEMRAALDALELPNHMSVIIRTAGIGHSVEDLQADLNHLLKLWDKILNRAVEVPSPALMHQEVGVVTRAVRDYLRNDISQIIIDNPTAFDEAYEFVNSVMPAQLEKLVKHVDRIPLFSRYGVERQIETAYQREVKLPSGGSIVIDQTEALVAIDINSAKATKGGDVEETALNTNLEAADEIARQLRLRDMGGLVVIDFIDMGKDRNQREVEERLRAATHYDRARIQFGQLSRFGLMEMSRQRLRPSLEEATGHTCPRCDGTGMLRDSRSVALSVMRRLEEMALIERQGELQLQVPLELASFLTNEKRGALLQVEANTGVKVTVLPNSRLEVPQYHIQHFASANASNSMERMQDISRRAPLDLDYQTQWSQPSGEQTAVRSFYEAELSGNSKPAAPKPGVITQTVSALKLRTLAMWLWLVNLTKPSKKQTVKPSKAAASKDMDRSRNGKGRPTRSNADGSSRPPQRRGRNGNRSDNRSDKADSSSVSDNKEPMLAQATDKPAGSKPSRSRGGSGRTGGNGRRNGAAQGAENTMDAATTSEDATSALPRRERGQTGSRSGRGPRQRSALVDNADVANGQSVAMTEGFNAAPNVSVAQVAANLAPLVEVVPVVATAELATQAVVSVNTQAEHSKVEPVVTELSQPEVLVKSEASAVPTHVAEGPGTGATKTLVAELAVPVVVAEVVAMAPAGSSAKPLQGGRIANDPRVKAINLLTEPVYLVPVSVPQWLPAAEPLLVHYVTPTAATRASNDPRLSR